MLAEMGLSVALATVGGAPQGIERGRGTFKRDLALIGGVMAADLASTEWAIAIYGDDARSVERVSIAGEPGAWADQPTVVHGAEEGNPLVKTRAVRIGSTVVLAVTTAYALQRLEQDGNRRAAGAVRGLLVGQRAGVVGVNVATALGPGLTSGKAWSIVGGAAVVGAVVGWVRARK